MKSGIFTDEVTLEEEATVRHFYRRSIRHHEPEGFHQYYVVYRSGMPAISSWVDKYVPTLVLLQEWLRNNPLEVLKGCSMLKPGRKTLLA